MNPRDKRAEGNLSSSTEEELKKPWSPHQTPCPLYYYFFLASSPCQWKISGAAIELKLG